MTRTEQQRNRWQAEHESTEPEVIGKHRARARQNRQKRRLPKNVLGSLRHADVSDKSAWLRNSRTVTIRLRVTRIHEMKHHYNFFNFEPIEIGCTLDLEVH